MRIKPSIKEVKAVRLSVLLGILTFSIPSTQTFAETSPLSSRPDPVNWIVGPAKADIGNNAEIQIPGGFRFVGAQDARTLLQLMRNPAPDTLAGILTPNSGSYIVVLESSPVGYVKDSSATLNSDKILLALQKKVERQNAAATQGAVPIASLQWDMEPQYDRSEHLMEWAIRAETGSSASVNHVVRRLGRDTMLDAIAVQSGKSTDTIPLKALMANVSFKPGHAYADYQEGDRLAKMNLAELITAEPGSISAESPKWAYIVGGASLFAVGGGLLVFKRKPHNPKSALANTISHVNGNGSKLFANGSSPRVNGHSNGNGHANGNGHSKRKHRHRTFDYQKYYSDLMFQVSDRAHETAFTPKSSRNSSVASVEKPNTDQTVISASLIEGQKRLIEEQQRLIREQSKLIEEKTRLIHEKNQVLDKQSELFGNNVF
jgi:uncharacterized membrane-anchored protein